MALWSRFKIGSIRLCDLNGGVSLADRSDSTENTHVEPAGSTSVIAESDQWRSLTCAACDAVTRVLTSELKNGDAISCRDCWQPLDYLESKSAKPALASDETRHGDETLHDIHALLAVERAAAARRAWKQTFADRAEKRRQLLELKSPVEPVQSEEIESNERPESQLVARDATDSELESKTRAQDVSPDKSSAALSNRVSDVPHSEALSKTVAPAFAPAPAFDAAAEKIARIELAEFLKDASDDESPKDRWASLKRGLERRRDDFAGAIVSVVIHSLLWLILAACVVQFKNPWGDTAFNLSLSEDAMILESDGAATADQAADAIDDAPFVAVQNVRVDHLLAGGAPAVGIGDGSFQLPSTADLMSGSGDSNWAIEPGLGFVGRSLESRAELAAKSGGTKESEDAVEDGLRWLARTQLDDGSWNFTEATRVVAGRAVGSSGRSEPMAATAMSLMCFLGAGYTHHDGKYKAEVQKGLDFLVKGGKRTGDFRGDGDLYSHGLVSIALCEAYGMTHDGSLRAPAQSSLDFIADSQHAGGGWRYQPNQAGDTSVVGWQVMAIASGRMAGLQTTRMVTGKTVQYLDIVHNKTTGTYGYTSAVRAGSTNTTAIGTLCRMYLHFGFDSNVMKKSVLETAKLDPVGNDLYNKYYAIQVLHHVGGPVWEKWNAPCRDHLVKLQVKSADHAGSWQPLSSWAVSAGGRHYETCLSIMCLEVYYRHLPIYKDAAFQ